MKILIFIGICIFIFMFILIIINIKTTKSNTEINKLEKKSHNLDSLAESDNPDDWFEVAKSNSATETHLITITKKCVSLDSDKETQLKIAEAIINNSAITDHVKFIISKSDNPDICILIWQ